MTDTNDAWYYSNGADRKGPVPLASMPALADAGVITSHTKVWREGMGEWEPAFKHVRGVLPPPPAPGIGARPPLPAAPGEGATDYQRQVGFGQAFGLFWSRYFDFSGRSNRGEFWWWMLASVLISFALAIADFALTGDPQVQPLTWLFGLAALIPSLALGARRLHDTDRSGWWWLILLIPIVGAIVLIVWWCQQGTRAPNRFA